MAKYNKVTTTIVEELKKIVGEQYVFTEADKLTECSHDEVNDPHYFYSPEVVVAPGTKEEIAAIVKLANRELIPVVPRGAGTGMACAAVPIHGGIVLMTDRFDKIIKVDADNMYIEVEPGVRTEVVQNAAKAQGMYYPGDPCSGDSCYIGGNVATNAGGNKAVKYGTTRDQVYSLEIVTPKGEITTLGSRLNKCSTGYAMEQLIIGSEGTLGIVTRMVLRLAPLPKECMDLLMIFTDTTSAIACVSKILKAGVNPTCLEFMDNASLKCLETYLNEPVPHSADGYYLIIQVEADSEEELENKAALIDEICTAGGAIEGLVADEKVWKIRKNAAEAYRHECLVQSNEDIVVPVDYLPSMMDAIVAICEKHSAITRIVAHAGDGNMHVCIMQGNISDSEWETKLSTIQDEIYTMVYPIGARLSGEHGIGFKKKALMEKFTDPVELDMMRAVKKALDPNNILNPGKIFDVE